MGGLGWTSGVQPLNTLQARLILNRPLSSLRQLEAFSVNENLFGSAAVSAMFLVPAGAKFQVDGAFLGQGALNLGDGLVSLVVSAPHFYP